MKNGINAMLKPRRMAQGVVVLLFSAVHFAACVAVGGFIALQHENPDPETEKALRTLLHGLREPLANPLIDTFRLDGLIYYPAYGLNSLLWGLTAYLLGYAVFAGLRWLWRTLVGAATASA